MLRSGSVSKIQGLAAGGKPIREIARELGLARNTVRTYLRSGPRAAGRRQRGSKLDPYKERIVAWVRDDHLYNCVTMHERLRALGYTGEVSTVKAFVRPLRPAAAGQRPVLRYETEPGQQMQFDWGEFVYEQEGARRKVFGFTAVLGYSRMRFVVFVKRCDSATLIRCVMAACEYFGGLPKIALTDRMKSVFLEKMDGKEPVWNPVFADFMASIGVVPRVCRPYTPQTKGKVERSVGVVKQGFWPGVTFTDLDDLNRQAGGWCDGLNRRRHRTTRRRPVDLHKEERLRPLPPAFAWERFATEERRVSWDGFLSYDGVLYGLPSAAAAAGGVVQVREREGHLTVWQRGARVVTLDKEPRSGEIVAHPDQFTHVLPAAAARRRPQPLGHQVPAPIVAQRSAAQYDALYGVEVFA